MFMNDAIMNEIILILCFDCSFTIYRNENIVDLGQKGFELYRSTYIQIFKNKHFFILL